ncbi:hypothetical protein HDV57DRAFT_483865 [Trichoderma longibrachiatum]
MIVICRGIGSYLSAQSRVFMWLVLFTLPLPISTEGSHYTLRYDSKHKRGHQLLKWVMCRRHEKPFMHALGICHDNEAPQSQDAANVHS